MRLASCTTYRPVPALCTTVVRPLLNHNRIVLRPLSFSLRRLSSTLSRLSDNRHARFQGLQFTVEYLQLPDSVSLRRRSCTRKHLENSPPELIGASPHARYTPERNCSFIHRNQRRNIVNLRIG